MWVPIQQIYRPPLVIIGLHIVCGASIKFSSRYRDVFSNFIMSLSTRELLSDEMKDRNMGKWKWKE